MSKVVKKNNLKVNIIFNAAYQVIILIIPFITSPYLSRVLTASGIGSYSYAFSIVNYFITTANFGFLAYGTVLIAKVRDNKEDYSQTFWNLFFTKLILLLLNLFAFYILVATNVFELSSYPLNTQHVYLILSLFIIGQGLDMTFFFQGLEQFTSLCVRNFCIKVLNLILIMLFVKSSSDYRNYVIIMSSTFLLAPLVMYPKIVKNISKPKWNDIHIFTHIKQSFAYFLPNVFTIIYTTISKTFVGRIINDSEASGYLENATKLINLVTVVVNSVNVVMMSRISFLYKQENKGAIASLIDKVFELYIIISIPAFAGLMAVNGNFTPAFFGQEYAESVNLIYILAPTILFSSLSDIIESVYYIPSNHIWKRTLFLGIGALVNIVSSYLLIKFIGIEGAAISTVVTQFLIMVLYIVFCKKEVSFKAMATPGIQAFDASLIMVIAIYFINLLFSGKISGLVLSLIQIFAGVVVYGLLLILFKEKLIIRVLDQTLKKLKTIFHK